MVRNIKRKLYSSQLKFKPEAGVSFNTSQNIEKVSLKSKHKEFYEHEQDENEF